jgi:hypothetical protein
MRASRRITTIAATALVAAAFTAGTAIVASASITGKDMGNGATLQAAEHDAYVLLRPGIEAVPHSGLAGAPAVSRSAVTWRLRSSVMPKLAG